MPFYTINIGFFLLFQTVLRIFLIIFDKLYIFVLNIRPEWKKMRNRYLDLQKKKMKEFKQYLNRQRFAPRGYDKNLRKINVEIPQIKDEPKEKLEFVSGVIVKVKLPEPIIDAKKIKVSNGRENIGSQC